MAPEPVSSTPRLVDVIDHHTPSGSEGNVQCWCGDQFHSYREHAEHTTSAWSDARRLTTVEQLDKLPPGSVVMPLWNLDAGPCHRLTDGWFMVFHDKPVHPLGTGRKGESVLLVWHPEWADQ